MGRRLADVESDRLPSLDFGDHRLCFSSSISNSSLRRRSNRPSISAKTAGRKPPVLLGGELAQPAESVAGFEGEQVDEVPSFGAPEQGQDFVDGKLQRLQGRGRLAQLDRKQPGVCGEVDLGPVATSHDDKSGKPGLVMDANHGETGVPERRFDGRNEVIDGSRAQFEEVEIACLALHFTADDECRAARAKSVASSNPAMISATRRWIWLSM